MCRALRDFDHVVARAASAARDRRRDRRRRGVGRRRRGHRRRDRPPAGVQRAADASAPPTGASRASRACTVGEKITPISSAGLFVPSGKASYPSVAYQLAVPATVAGVPQLALVVPPMPDGGGADRPGGAWSCAASSGIDNVFRVNGPAGRRRARLRHRVDPAGAQDRRARQPTRRLRPGRDAALRRGHDDDPRARPRAW